MEHNLGDKAKLQELIVKMEKSEDFWHSLQLAFERNPSKNLNKMYATAFELKSVLLKAYSIKMAKKFFQKNAAFIINEIGLAETDH